MIDNHKNDQMLSIDVINDRKKHYIVTWKK